jgi:hypothetical protein
VPAWTWKSADPGRSRLYELPDLLPLGMPDLLLASTRRTLCRARDRAVEAQQAAAARVLPCTVEWVSCPR